MKCQVSIDWLTFTVRSDNPDDVIRDFLGMDPDLFQLTGLSLMGFHKVKKFSDINVCWEGREDTHFHLSSLVCVSMSGNGCRAFETFSKLSPDKQTSPFLPLFNKLMSDDNIHVTRIDIACDDRDGVLDMDLMAAKVREGAVNTRLTSRDIHQKFCGEANDGMTIYIGSPSSDFRLRIYDKAKEQGIEGHWVRVEMVLRAEHSRAFVSQVASGEDVGTLAAKVLNEKFLFIERDDTNISRCSVCVWWSAFVQEVEAVKLVARCVIQHAVERIDSWVSSQVGPSLYILAHTMGLHRLYEISQSAADRLSRKQEALIADFNSLCFANAQNSPQLSAAT